MAKNEHDTRDVLAKLPPVDTFAEVDGRFIGYRNGVEVWSADTRSFPHIIVVLAAALRRR